jgi:hypothetical protein
MEVADGYTHVTFRGDSEGKPGRSGERSVLRQHDETDALDASTLLALLFDFVTGTDADGADVAFEPRWPIALVVVSFIVITVVLRVAQPERTSLGPHWLEPTLEIALLVALFAAHPSRIEERSRWLRPLAISLIVTLTIVALLSTGVLVVDLVTGSKVTDSATSLLASGALIWLGNAVVFGLLYWELDSGGPIARAHRTRPYPDFAFSQQLSPEMAPPEWRPRYMDYFILGITTSTAFSPTDVMPMTAWAKLTMALQSLVSLTVVGLVIARAVNVFQ